MAKGGDGIPVPSRGRLPEYEKIQNNFPFLQRELSSRPLELMWFMFSKNVIDYNDVEKIQKRRKHGTKAAAGEILQVLLQCGPGAYDKFIECLVDTNNVKALQKLEPDIARELQDQSTLPDHKLKTLRPGYTPCGEDPGNDSEPSFIGTAKKVTNKILNMVNKKCEDSDRRSGNIPHRRPSPKVSISFQNKLRKIMVVYIYQEDVVDIHADILVCYKYGISKHEGRIAKRLREKGGKKYVASLDKSLQGASGLQEWWSFFVNPGNLQFSHVCQTIIPPNPAADVMDVWLSNLQGLYQFILFTADERGYKSITFPVVNSDCIEKCIDVLITAIKNHESPNLRQVNIVTTEDKSIGKILKCLPTEGSNVLGQDSSTKAEVDKTKEDYDSNSSTMEHPPHILSNGLVLHLRKADIVDVHSGVIINSTHGKAEKEGKIAKRLRQKGGVEYVKSLENLVRVINGFKDWEIYSSDSGELLFSEVFQVIIPPNPPDDAMDDWLSELQGLNSLILTTADARGYTSITLPVLGSGETGAEAEKCIQGLKKALEEYVPNNLLHVYIVTINDFIFTLLSTSLQKQN